MKKSLLAFAFIALYSVISLATAQQAVFERTALDDYIDKADPSFSYSHYHTEQGVGFTTYFISLTSQQWRTIAEVDRTLWEHELIITVPWVLHTDSENTAVLLIGGGKNEGDPTRDADPLMGLVAQSLGSVTAIIKQIPNQPLAFTDEPGTERKEDAILAYSMDKFLLTGDPQWPVHLPMTKAVIRAMDTMQEFLDQESDTVKLFDIPQINDFILLGGSKRGWTTWLVAAAETQRAQGSRVKAIIPASIDLLNLDEQFVHHWEAYGLYSPAIEDYVDFDLPCRVKTVEGRNLLEIIDPYEYRDRLTIPKLLLHSAGDQFFLPDSWQFYYADLPGPKHMRYTPNTDHSQSQDFENIVLAAVSWMDDVNDRKAGPRFDWSMEADGSIRVQTFSAPKSVRLWQATNPAARDFRLETIGPAWTSTPLEDSGEGIYIGWVPLPSQGWTAFTVELTFDEPALLESDQVYTTGVRVVPELLPFAGTHCPGLPAIGPQTPGLYQPMTRTFDLKIRDTLANPDILATYDAAGSGWVPLSGDWNGDGLNGLGLFDPQNRIFYLKNEIALGDPDAALNYPWAADGIPITGDWDGDGQDSLGVYFPSTRTFGLKNDLTTVEPDILATYAAAGDNWLPVSGDWNGDGQDGLGLFDPQTRIFYLKNEISLGDADFIVGYEEAPVGWIPLAGDWDGDGRDTLGLYQPDTETFYLKNTIQPGMPDKIMQYGPRQDAWAPIVGLWK